MICKLVGKRLIEGSKDGRNYSFYQLQLVASEKQDRVEGQAVYSVVPDFSVDTKSLIVGTEYNFFTYVSNGRVHCNGVTKV